MDKVVVSIANTLGQTIAGLERVWLCRNDYCRSQNIQHVLLVQLGVLEHYQKDYLDGFGQVVFLGQEGDAKSLIDTAMRDFIVAKIKTVGQSNLVVINDDPHYRMPKTWHYLKMASVKHYHFIHYDVLERAVYGDKLGQLRRDANYIVCNPRIEDGMKCLGFTEVRFLPAVFSMPQDERVKKGQGYCLVANQNPVKRVSMALATFSTLYQEGWTDATLTLFGQLPEPIIEQARQMPNVILAGAVEEIPYAQFSGLISCSATEAFSNSVVEASGWGLDLLLSHNRCHDFYLEDILKRKDSLFSTAEDLYQLLVGRCSDRTLRVNSLPLAEANSFLEYSRLWGELFNDC